MLKCTRLSRATIGSSFGLPLLLTHALCSLKGAGRAAIETLLCLKTPRRHPGFIAGPALQWRLRRVAGVLPKRERQAMIETNGIDHIVLHVADVRRARDFYSGVLGMTVYREK